MTDQPNLTLRDFEAAVREVIADWAEPGQGINFLHEVAARSRLELPPSARQLRFINWARQGYALPEVRTRTLDGSPDSTSADLDRRLGAFAQAVKRHGRAAGAARPVPSQRA